MPKDIMPIQVNPIRFAENGVTMHGSLFIKDMQRLGVSLAGQEGEVKVDLEFGIDREKTRFVKGHFETALTLQCQRCLENFIQEVVGDLKSGLVNNEKEANALSSRYEPLIVVDNNLVIQDMIEDELILTLPIVPMHDLKDCSIQLPQAAGDAEMTEFKKESPFKVIEHLKKEVG